ncbi:transcription factor Adf-1-like [Metopolophium dirhodum]|uniref:transcription factor Adf-1-like n=1 Tax=Metopolophium dirhodum TaxID=44670 RepID=UPI00298F7233|nr:transcription factor Adf-1-like [Metopolophium dirhodum]
MNTEMLIELVRERPSLYDMSDKRNKESLWREIASEINQPVQNCKKNWTSLRDGYRRAAKKSITVSGQKTKFVKKWKYADEMEFLKSHMKERDSISNIDVVTDDEDDVLSHSDDEKNSSGR